MDKFEISDIIKVTGGPYYTLWPKSIIRIRKLKKSIIRLNVFSINKLGQIKMVAA
jgi:hypothetical protein